MATTAKILLVEDNPLDARLIREIVKNARILTFELTCVDTLAAALKQLELDSFDAILADLSLGDSQGIDTFWKIQNQSQMTPIIVLTGTDDESLALELLQKGAQDYLIKGQLNRNQIERSISYALERHKILDELKKSRESLAATKEELEEALSNINAELETARRVQKSFLPQDTFKIKSVNINSQYLPSGRVGGDLYDIVPLDDHRTAVLLVDVAGHGVPAALISAMAKLSFSRHIYKGISPQEIFHRVNNELIHYMPPERFVTAILGIVDTQNMEFTHVRAANPPALLFHKETNKCDYLTTTGTFIGLFPDVPFEQKSAPIRPGDKIVLYTDGLIECINNQGKQFGKIKLENAVLGISSLNAKDFNLEIINKIQNYTTGLPQSDDITMVTIELL